VVEEEEGMLATDFVFMLYSIQYDSFVLC